MSSEPKLFYHGTRADLKPGDLIAAGYNSNYGERKAASWVYLSDGHAGRRHLGRRARRRRRTGKDLHRRADRPDR